MSEAIAAAFPEPFSGSGVDAGEDTVIESVDVLVVGDGFVEFEFEAAGGGPDFSRSAILEIAWIKQDAAGVVAGAEEDEIVKPDGLSNVDLVLICPGIEPERFSGVWVMCFETISVEYEELSLTVDEFEPWCCVAGGMAADSPDWFAGRLIVGDECVSV